jgi:hypothetical protein
MECEFYLKDLERASEMFSVAIFTQTETVVVKALYMFNILSTRLHKKRTKLLLSERPREYIYIILATYTGNEVLQLIETKF